MAMGGFYWSQNFLQNFSEAEEILFWGRVSIWPQWKRNIREIYGDVEFWKKTFNISEIYHHIDYQNIRW